ncbi:MAG: Peptidyl-tRNA hydrolase [Candidatus Uhrbacteria bacterium GW2011_GWE2_45_35]|uniref:Peptidyl-tRNA hydrolase n=1 Tax=Candidatus Uhrbacteria bacterium GW2011_GWE2_45_35 TaxID=1618993 RepID=A0A0G1MEF9_9BACT|nr:MAG: Peptidyl-tRNA hydrolase [Candidatus Uhrbacteria bacterium GW2011_GWE2_45_35]HBR80433.1 aminoacyl-tRNA hydrolase [Candidatus Uhrbacteria bacterium]HCU31445.1 aminoacyl-tRNA hydrolase [Candidatus Uhrbacteria bacterium]
MCLIIGLGNPGKKYERTRHNVGFLVLDELATLADVKFKNKKDLSGLVAETKINGRSAELLQPTTFMNLSGEAVVKAAKFWRVPEKKITVIVDDVNLPLGQIRIREKGSAGGHNGLRSIIERLDTSEIRRIRIGIGRPPRPEMALDKWVLEKLNKEDWKTVVEAARQVAKDIFAGQIKIG